MARFGFEPPDQPAPEDDDEESEPSHVGHVGQLTVPKDFDVDDEEEDEDDGPQTGWWFLNHVYVAVQIGPFAVVIGRPENV